MRLILLILFLLFLYWFVKNILIPVVKSYLMIRRQQKQFHEQWKQSRENAYQNQHAKPEGHVEIRENGKKGKSRFNSEKGDYIDYKEEK